MSADLPVVYNAVLTRMYKLYGVFDGDYVIFSLAVHLVDYRRERCRLAASGRTRHNDDASRQKGQPTYYRGEAKLLDCENFVRNLAKHRSDPVFLHEEIHPVTGKPWNFISEIEVSGFLEYLDLIFRGDLVEHRAQFVVVQNSIFYALQVASNPQNRLLPRNKMYVGGFLFVHQFEKGIYFSHGLSLERC